MSTGREKHKLTNPFDIILSTKARPEPHRDLSHFNDPFKKARKARLGTTSAVSHLHDGFKNAGKELAEQRPMPFGEILQMLLPPKLATTKGSTEPRAIMERLKKIGKTSWFVFKHVIKIVQAVSSSCPQLQYALEALSLVLDQIEIMKDAQDGFFEVSSKLSAVQFILYRHRHSPDDQAQERLSSFAEWANSIKVYIEMHTKQNVAIRFFTASGDQQTTIQLLQSLASILDFFMLDINLNVEDRVRRLEMKVDDLADHVHLQGLNHVAEAGWSSQSDEKCLTGTRCVVMSDLMEWCQNPEKPRVFWLSGMAGTGKSAIARTLCDKLSTAHLLGGSFFCSRRSSAGQRDIRRIIPTLTRQLARLDPEYRHNVVECLKRDSDISTATVDKQLEQLLMKPCSDALRSLPTPLILVIDALDEGAEADEMAQLLEAILKTAGHMPFRFFLTSRPESHIRERFLKPSSSTRTILRLHEIEESMVKADIELYVKHRLNKIKDSNQKLPEEWPTNGQVQKLADRADKLFIYAFTACNYIKRDPVTRLDIIIQTAVANERPLMQRLDDMYTLILDEAKNAENAGRGIVSDIQKCLTALVCVQETLSVTGLASLMVTSPERIRIVMDDLHSLILVPESNDDGPVTTLHASLGDYLTDEQRSKHHAITKDVANWILLRRCFQVLSKELHFNISGATTSFLSNDQQRLKLPHTLVYSSAEWVRHMTEITPSEELLTTVVTWVKSILIPKFLFWLEVMSVSKKVGDIPGMLRMLLAFVEEQDQQDVVQFLRDALSFVNGSREAIQRSTPHIYLSALALCQHGSRIEREFANEYGGIPLAFWNGIIRSKIWLLCIGEPANAENMFDSSQDQAVGVQSRDISAVEPKPLGMHTGIIFSIAFSPDGKYIASGSGDDTVRVWDALSGRQIIRMGPFHEHPSLIRSIEFSPDGKYVVSGSGDGTVRLWDVHSGRLTMKPLKGHTGLVHSVKFSPDGKYIVSGSYDATIRLWDAKTGRLIMKISEGHTSSVYSVAFSPDSKRIVSGLDDKTVRVWDAKKGRPVMKPLEGHTELVGSVAYSPDGKFIISGSRDKTIRIWDARTGRSMMEPLQGHMGEVNSVAFSPDGKYIASGSDDKTVRMWDVRTGSLVLGPLQGHMQWVRSVQFSPDGKYIISSSDDRTVRVWDAQTVQALESTHENSSTKSASTLHDDDIRIQNPSPTASFYPIFGPSAVTDDVCFSPHAHHGFSLPSDLIPSTSINPKNDLRDDFIIYPKRSGWILGPDNELFLWIPADIRSSLWLPRTTDVEPKEKLYLDLSEYSCGSRWTDCRRPMVSKWIRLGVTNDSVIEDYKNDDAIANRDISRDSTFAESI